MISAPLPFILDFINDAGADLPDEDVVMGSRRHSIPMRDEEEDIDEIERQVRERYARSTHIEYGEEAAEVEQQALLPSVKDPKLWMVKCAVCSRFILRNCLDVYWPYFSSTNA